MNRRKNKGFRISSIIFAKCPSCHKGKVLDGFFSIRPRCQKCNYNFYPEPGFYVGAIAVGFLLAAVTTVPPLIIMKVLDVDVNVMLIFPFIEFIFVGTFLTFYSRIIWLHLQYRLTNRLDGDE